MDFEYDIIEDDDELDEMNLIQFGIPRKIYERAEYFNSFDELSFFRRFRLTKNTTLFVLANIEHELEFPYNLNNCVSPINQLLVTLRYYATGNHLISVADFSGMHTSTVCRIIVRVSEAVARLYNQFIKMPETDEDIRRTQNEIYELAAFPRIVGLIDCTHIKIQSPGDDDPEIFRNRKGYFSFNVQAICDAKLRIMNVVARWPGSTHDATIFNNSTVKAQFEAGLYGNGILLGDSGYPLKHYLLTPLLNPASAEEQMYNESHIRSRNAVERLFGVVKRRFPVLAYGCRLKKLDTIMAIIVATCILHNIAIRDGEDQPPVPEDVDEEHLNQLILHGQMNNVPNNINNNLNQNLTGIQMRNQFVRNYFGNLQ